MREAQVYIKEHCKTEKLHWVGGVGGGSLPPPRGSVKYHCIETLPRTCEMTHIKKTNCVNVDTTTKGDKKFEQ